MDKLDNFKLLNYIRDLCSISKQQKLSLLILVTHRNSITGICNPAQALLKKEMSYKNTDKISKLIKKLKELGLIMIHKLKSKNYYFFDYDYDDSFRLFCEHLIKNSHNPSCSINSGAAKGLMHNNISLSIISKHNMNMYALTKNSMLDCAYIYDKYEGKHCPTGHVLELFEVLLPGNEGYIQVSTDASGFNNYFFEKISEALSHVFQDGNEKYNFWFGVCKRASKLATKPGVKQASVLWCDIDYGTAGHKQDNYFKTLPEALEFTVNFELPPSAIVHSGHGLQVYWLLDEPVNVEDPSMFEGYLRGLTKYFQADSSAAKINQILRIPGTYNVKELTNGIKVTVISLNPDLKYKINDFDKYYVEKISGGDVAGIEFTDTSLDVDINQLNIPEEVKSLIITGNYEGSRFETRSHADQYVIFNLIKAGYSYDIVQSIFCDKKNGISGKYYDEKEKYHAEYYLKRSIASAEALIAKQKSIKQGGEKS